MTKKGGWYNDRPEHSLAARGIKTRDKKSGVKRAAVSRAQKYDTTEAILRAIKAAKGLDRAPSSADVVHRYSTFRESYTPLFENAKKYGASGVELLPGDWNDEWASQAELCFYDGKKFTVVELGEGWGLKTSYKKLSNMKYLDDSIREGENPGYKEEYRLYTSRKELGRLMNEYAEERLY